MDKIKEIKLQLESVFNKNMTLEELNNIKVEYLGKKGIITELNAMIKDLPKDDKKDFGMKVNELRTIFSNKYDEIKDKLEREAVNKKLESERIDITLPATKIKRGSKHPMSLTIEEIG